MEELDKEKELNGYSSTSSTEYSDSILFDEWDSNQKDFTKKFNRLRNIVESGATEVKVNANTTASASNASTSRQVNHKLNMAFATKDNTKTKKDKADRATVEQVLDGRTRLILFKLMNRGYIDNISGCISTGKEGNVYSAEAFLDNLLYPIIRTNDASTEQELKLTHLAVKIYKTSILVFKDRDRYVTGEYRFRHGYSKSNPRKMVQTWAEKELRNLKRLIMHGIPAPEPIILRQHVLVMKLIGTSKGRAAPRLKDAVISSEEEFFDAYKQIVRILWILYNKCKLIHADFSEYNLLYYKKIVYVIDVSQSVEHDHPHALEFLRKDCENVILFFAKHLQCHLFTLHQFFEFVVTDADTLKETFSEFANIQDENEFLNKVFELKHQEIQNRTESQVTELQQKDDLFKQMYIPRTLDEVIDFEEDIEKFKAGNDLIYSNVTGLMKNVQIDGKEDDNLDSNVEESDEFVSEEEGSSVSELDSDIDLLDNSSEPELLRPKLKKDEDKDAKKERKKQVKEQKAAKRLVKVKKSAKKQKIKKTKK
jgi:RIO kinase 1